MARNDRRWAYQPVDPCTLFNLLEACLGLDGEGVKTPVEITKGAMPLESDPNFRDKYLLREVLRKYPGFDLGVDTRLAAKTSFYEDEEVNRLTNDRLIGERPEAVIGEVLASARKKIAEICGRFCEAEFWHGWRFGPKSTISLRRSQSATENKLTLELPAVTVEALPLFRTLLQKEPFWSYCMSKADANLHHTVEHKARICQFDRWQGVSKNAWTDRGIGVPPDGNVPMQLSVGKMLRARLYKHGVNLNDQSHNQQMALRGSEAGEVATVDVKSASQSLTCGLVWNLLGSQNSRDLDWRWYWVMDKLRTPYTLIDGDLHENELFSAMGNGYTFELESLVFYSLAWACTSYLGEDTALVSVYGDDIVLPVGVFPLLLKVFAFCGFRINEDKTFASTGAHRFRESCGKHFLNGVDVTPFYVDTVLDNPGTIILAANNLLRWACRPGYRDGRVFPVWVYLVSHLAPEYFECRIPLSDSNDGLIADWDEVCPHLVWLKSEPGSPVNRTLIGYKAKTVELAPRPRPLDDTPRYLRWQYHASGHTGFKPPPRQLLGGRRWKSKEFARDEIEPSLKVAPEPGRSISAKASLRLGSRVVTSWPRLGPWVADGLYVEEGDWELYVQLRSVHVEKLHFPPLHRNSPMRGRQGRVKQPSIPR